MASKHSHCCYCSMQCGLELVPSATEREIDNAATYTVKPSSDFPVATGRLCQKGFNVLEHVIHPSRITCPLFKQKASSSSGAKTNEASTWQTKSWDHAFDQISSSIQEIQQTYGRDAVAVYGGGSLTNEVCYLLGKFTRVALKSKHIDYNGRYCMSTAAAASNKAFGIDRGLTMPLSEISNSKYIILAGTNIAECQPTMMPYLMEAKKNKAIIVTIDPRNTMTSKIADIHVRVQPGFDSVFTNGLLHVILNEQLYNVDYVKNHTNGFAELAEAVKSYTPQRVEELTGVLEAVTRTIARGFAKAESGIVLTARGLEQQVNGVENTLNYMNLSLVTGKMGRRGCGYGAVTGQANGQGGREHGQKADQLPGYQMIDDPQARESVAKVWGINPDDLPGKGVSAYEMIEKIDTGEIQAMIILGSNPIVSSPNAHFVEKAFQKLKLLIVVDMFETDTARYADWLLPGSSFIEAEGTITNLEGRVFHRPQAFSTPGESMLDYQIICQLAKRLGSGQYFNYDSIEAVFNELCLATAGGKADYAGMSYERLKSNNGLFWPCPTADHPGTPQLFKERYNHLDGKAKLFGIVPKMPAEPVDREFPYVLSTGRVGSHYLSGEQTRRTDALMKKAPVPVAELHPWLANQIGLGVHSRIRLTSRRGSLVLDVKITEGIHPRTIFVPFHWAGEMSINRLTNDKLEPTSRMPEFKICAVKAERVDVSSEEKQ